MEQYEKRFITIVAIGLLITAPSDYLILRTANCFASVYGAMGNHPAWCDAHYNEVQPSGYITWLPGTLPNVSWLIPMFIGLSIMGYGFYESGKEMDKHMEARGMHWVQGKGYVKIEVTE